MNYDHHYHAGNFADVFKHVILVNLISVLKQKDKPFCIIDAQAGYGLYNIQSEQAYKSKECHHGILPLMQQSKAPPTIQSYLSIIRELNNNTASPIQQYPGSSYLASALLRSQDRLIINECHPNAYETLYTLFRNNPQVALHERDAYELLPALLPPKEKRGLILIDPPFEDPHEFQAIIRVLKKSLARFPTGIYAIWYPIKDESISRFYHTLKALPIKNLLCCEISTTNLQHNLLGLTACGMVILNAPWQFEQWIEPALKHLWKTWSHDQEGYYSAKYLVQEN